MAKSSQPTSAPDSHPATAKGTVTQDDLDALFNELTKNDAPAAAATRAVETPAAAPVAAESPAAAEAPVGGPLHDQLDNLFNELTRNDPVSPAAPPADPSPAPTLESTTVGQEDLEKLFAAAAEQAAQPEAGKAAELPSEAPAAVPTTVGQDDMDKLFAEVAAEQATPPAAAKTTETAPQASAQADSTTVGQNDLDKLFAEVAAEQAKDAQPAAAPVVESSGSASQTQSAAEPETATYDPAVPVDPDDEPVHPAQKLEAAVQALLESSSDIVKPDPWWKRLLSLINLPVEDVDEQGLRAMGMIGIATLLNAIILTAWAIVRMQHGS